MSIPKKIHYCWFGNGKLSQEAEESIESWKKYLPEYEMVLWSEGNFDVRINQYVSEAYDAGKYAYVTDYVRLYALREVGGIYFDTDVEVLKSFNDLLHHRAMIGYEGNSLLGTGIIGSESHHPWIQRLMNVYDKKPFILEDGTYDVTTNSVLVTKVMLSDYEWKNEDRYQVLKDDVNVFSSEIFSAKDSESGMIFANENTYSIHHFG